MAATAWAFYNEAKHKLAVGDASGFNLSADIFRIALYSTSEGAGAADTATLSIQSQVSIECSGGAYVAGGQTLSNTSWAATAATTQKFDGDDWIMTATGTTISAVLFAAICNSVTGTSGFLLCWSKLSTAEFDVTTGNTLTIQMNTAGIFTLA